MPVEILRLTAFSNDPEGGNPAGVVLDASGLTDREMLAIAADVGYSETAFLIARPKDGAEAFDIRYFSPVGEVDFCGHATIAAGIALGQENGPSTYDFNTNAGPVELEVFENGDDLVVTLISPPASVRPLAEHALEALLDALDWDFDDLDPRFPPAVGFAGNAHPVLVADSRDRLAELDYDFDDLLELMVAEGWTTIQLVYPDEGDPSTRKWHSRNPFPIGGVYEDAATGSAAAALGGYLRQHGIAGVGDQIQILQGDDMGRPSLILLTVGGSQMQISGTGIQI
ncbi:MAG: PhzF family phenazine biosynthesis isomerase [Actinomycetales bacterium]|nr:PhzF family phenazine biosynthesis isomerase [Actinomycetales bacterium]